ncbi:MAG: peptidoglycan DD-metalloendopeptidase family protein [Planctomycetota bacterium]|nr:peptidoglycan DD-metalloendopeptidase family protein [Planctomycetota bacterium]
MKDISLSKRFVLAAILLCTACIGGAWAADGTVGACTRKDEFQKKQETVDKLVVQLTSAKSEAKAKAIAAEIAKKHGTSEIENLIRYREPQMKLVFVELLKAKAWPIRGRALYGLKMVGDESVIKNVLDMMNDKEIPVREMAVNTLSHIGNADAVKGLEKCKEKEKDPNILASIEAALKVLGQEQKPYAEYKGGKKWEEKLIGPDGAKRVEYAWGWKGEPLFNDYDGKAYDLPEATTFCYPISSYKTDLFASYPRNSFAAGGNHAAEDCAWFREGCSYYAIADGVVRMVQGAGGDWGFLVLIEHKLPGGEYIVSLYGHSAWDLLVKPGDMVKAGQKIATQGLSCSVENGGYGSHIHFGLGDGPYRRPKKCSKGDTYKYKDAEGKEVSGKIVRFGYSTTETDGYSFPKMTAVVETPDGKTQEVVMEDEPLQDQIAWNQPYVEKCKGWLNPEKFLPERVEPKKPDGKKRK